MNRKGSTAPVGCGNGTKGNYLTEGKDKHKSNKSGFHTQSAHKINHTATQHHAYTTTAKPRMTELRRARIFFLDHPNGTFSRADLVEALELPINHITRIVYDLIDSGFVEVSGRQINPRSGIVVEVVRLTKERREHE